MDSLYILLQDEIETEEVNKANTMLHNFVEQTQHYFGKIAMTFNIHSLLHLPEAVLNWGPLHCQSTFGFESANRYLLRAIKSAKGATMQISRHVNNNHSLLKLSQFLKPHISPLVRIFCEDVLDCRAQNYLKIDELAYVGYPEKIPIDFLETHDLPESAVFFKKLIKQRCLYESFLLNKERSNNAFARLDDKSFIRYINLLWIRTQTYS